MESAQKFTDRKLDEQTVVYPYNEYYPTFKKQEMWMPVNTIR